MRCLLLAHFRHASSKLKASVMREIRQLIVGTAFLVLGCGSPNPSAAQENAGLQNARSGRIACIAPANGNSRCNTLVRYQFKQDGSVLVVTDVTMSATPPITMSASYDASIVNGAFCGEPHVEDVGRATFVISGTAASATDTQNLRAQIVGNMQAQGRMNACMSYELVDGAWLARATVNGVRRPDMDAQMVWLPSNARVAVGP